MPQTVEVRFKGTRKAFFSWDEREALRVNDSVVVEAERGRDLGRVSAVGDTADKKCGTSCSGCQTSPVQGEPAEPLRPIVRRATTEDLRQLNENRRSEDDDRRRVVQRVQHHVLPMKVSDTEWQWDRAKLTIYFTAEKRVDFRALVRDLASLFRTRIELRQIGVRDEAARLTGIGRCGREYCCSTWLTNLSPVNLALAKDQHLSLNPSQISGGCGRLLCCLRYEHEFYVTARKRFPKEGKLVRTARGSEKVVAVDIFRERVFLRSEEHGPRIIPLVQLRDEMDRDEDATGGPVAPTVVVAPPSAPAPSPDVPRDHDRRQSAARPQRRRRRRRRDGGSGDSPPPA